MGETALGVNFGTIPASAFLGVVKFTSWTDYKGQASRRDLQPALWDTPV